MPDNPFEGIDWDEIPEAANPLPLLQRWYASQCDGDWEHQSGIEITTLDNPGWRIKINLSGTALEGESFNRIAKTIGLTGEPSAGSWMVCFVGNGTWNGAGDPSKLNAMLLLFLNWAADVDPGWPSR